MYTCLQWGSCALVHLHWPVLAHMQRACFLRFRSECDLRLWSNQCRSVFWPLMNALMVPETYLTGGVGLWARGAASLGLVTRGILGSNFGGEIVWG